MEDIKAWLCSQVADFFDTGMQKLISEYDRCLSSSGGNTGSNFMYVFFICNINIFFFLIACFDNSSEVTVWIALV
jgi:hypothetical protein